MSERLDGHVTMLIDGECWTFPLPDFHQTVVSGWGYGREGTFEQESYGDEAIAKYHRDLALWRKRSSRFGWVRSLRLPLPVRRDLSLDPIYFEDEEHPGYAWGWTTLGAVLHNRFVPSRPHVLGAHRVYRNLADCYVMEHTNNVLFQYNAIGSAA